ncbi:unnamed protein product [Dimorphilus gyrociliatus]|uniref:Uncharacterized protein n=1 Tax=Dimorphilus gyrociliatus TaxID=2664684 RepID=A0A7I8VEC4_9ANNE|nr:unnamed protein product [Dimorphilus gyrociliatus]
MIHENVALASQRRSTERSSHQPITFNQQSLTSTKNEKRIMSTDLKRLRKRRQRTKGNPSRRPSKKLFCKENGNILVRSMPSKAPCNSTQFIMEDRAEEPDSRGASPLSNVSFDLETFSEVSYIDFFKKDFDEEYANARHTALSNLDKHSLIAYILSLEERVQKSCDETLNELEDVRMLHQKQNADIS